jgi:hypothetical protein
MDIMQCATNTGFNTKVVGVTNVLMRGLWKQLLKTY